MARFRMRRTRRCGMATIVAVLTTATTGPVSAALSGAATGGCPGAPAERSVLRAAGVPERAPGSWGAQLSGDGRYVAFVSYADDPGSGDTNQRADVFRMDRATGEILRVSRDVHGM